MAALTSLINPIYDAMDSQNHQLAGFLPAVTTYGKLNSASKDEEIKLYDIAVSEAADYTQSMTLPDGSEPTTEMNTVKIECLKSVTFAMAGEKEKALDNQGRLVPVNQLSFIDAFNKLNDLIETYVYQKILASASRACGTAGTTPFATAGDMTDLAELGLIFDENGTPKQNRQLVLNNVAMANIRAKMSNLFKANEFGGTEFLRTGLLTAPLQNFNFFQSGAITKHTKGTGSGYVSSAAGAVKDTSISVDTGTGTVLAGDVVTFANDTNKYMVNTGITAPGTLAIGKPGLKSALADNTAMTIGGDYLPSIAFQRDTVKLGLRTPFIGSDGKDAAIDRTYVMSPLGIPYMISVYAGHGKNTVEVATAYGAGVERSANVAVLLG